MRPRLFVLAAPLVAVACTSLIGFPDLPDVGPDAGASGGSGDGGAADANHPGAVNEAGSTTEAGAAPDGSPDVVVSDACSGGSCTDVACPGTEVSCGGTCVDLTQSAASCGRCGHSCAPGVCQNSQCQPATLVSSIDVPTAFAVDPNGIYFAVDDVLKTCPLSGCASGERQIVTLQDMTLVAATNGSVVFVGDDPSIAPLDNPEAIYACPVAGCPDAALPEPLLSISHGPGSTTQIDELVTSGSDVYAHEVIGNIAPTHIERCAGLSGTSCTDDLELPRIGLTGAGVPSWSGTIATPIAADATQAYFVQQYPDGGTSISSTGNDALCDAAPCTSPVLWSVSPSHMVAYGGTLYFVGLFEYEGAACPASFGCGPLYSCPVTGCTTPTVLATLTAESVVNDIAADSSGVYFSTGAVIDSCPLGGCGVQGPVAIAGGQSSPTTVRVSGGFVYWVNGGSGGGTASIVTVAEP